MNLILQITQAPPLSACPETKSIHNFVFTSPTMRVSKRVLNLASHPVTFQKQSPPLLYSLGLSYAAKHSPPFVLPQSLPGTLGFGAKDGQEAQTKIAKWVDSMRALPAGRGELQPTEGEVGDGGWDEELQGRVRKWGAGEDFFAIVDAGSFVSRGIRE